MQLGIEYGPSLMLMLFTKFVPNSTIRRCSFGIKFYDYDAKFALNKMQIYRIYHQKSSAISPLIYKNKDAGTKMHISWD